MVLENHIPSVSPLIPTHATGEAREFPQDNTAQPHKRAQRGLEPTAGDSTQQKQPARDKTKDAGKEWKEAE